MKTNLSEEPETCCVCFENYRTAKEYIVTRCKHSFHPACLISAFDYGGSRPSCPLCRMSVKDLMPDGMDGQILSFVAMLKLNLTAADKCYIRFLHIIKSQIESTGKNDESQSNYNDLEASLRIADLFSIVNFTGFSRIIEKYETIMLLRCPEISKFLETTSFCRDARRIGSTKLRQDLQNALESSKNSPCMAAIDVKR